MNWKGKSGSDGSGGIKSRVSDSGGIGGSGRFGES